MPGKSLDRDREWLRHVLATIAYRGGKVLRDVSDETAQHRVGPASRTPLEILGHVNDLLDWAGWLARGEQKWRNTTPRSWAEEVTRFYAELAALDAEFASVSGPACPAEKLFQGPLADILTHLGQIAFVLGVAGEPVRGENYFVADIAAGSVGADQSPPKREFD